MAIDQKVLERAHLDMPRAIIEYGLILRSSDDPMECRAAVRALERLQSDERIDHFSRELARVLLKEFGAKHG